MIRAFIFDFDGLILDTETPIIDAWVQVHTEAGLSCARQQALDLIGEVDHSVDFWMAFGPTADRLALEQKMRQIKRARIESQALLPGARERIYEAHQQGFKLAIASNSPHRWVDSHLQRLGLFEYFATTLCRDDVARGKPEPDVYLAVTQALGVAPAEAVAFEDSKAGIVAAKRAGLRAVAVPNSCTRHHDFAQADLVAGSLAEFTLDELIKRFGD